MMTASEIDNAYYVREILKKELITWQTEYDYKQFNPHIWLLGAPEWEIVAFRPGKPGEFCIGSPGYRPIQINSKASRSRFIIQKRVTEDILRTDVVTARDIYGEDVKIPPGYSYVGFRVLHKGDIYIDHSSGAIYRADVYDANIRKPRIIVRKNESPEG